MIAKGPQLRGRPSAWAARLMLGGWHTAPHGGRRGVHFLHVAAGLAAASLTAGKRHRLRGLRLLLVSWLRKYEQTHGQTDTHTGFCEHTCIYLYCRQKRKVSEKVSQRQWERCDFGGGGVVFGGKCATRLFQTQLGRGLYCGIMFCFSQLQNSKQVGLKKHGQN